MQQNQKRLQQNQESLQREQRLKKEQKDIQHRFGINVLEETARFHELERQKKRKNVEKSNIYTSFFTFFYTSFIDFVVF